MKHTYNTKTALILVILLLYIYGCSKSSDNTPNTGGSTTPPPKTIVVPTVDTAVAIPLQSYGTYVVSHDSVVSGGDVLSDGGATVTARGVCWSTSQNPTVANSKTANGSGTGGFSSAIGGLTVNTTYYARAYATNSAGTGYSAQVHFTTAFKIGEYYQGGLIFSIDATTLHGLIVTAEDQSDAPWENTTNAYYLSAGAYSVTDGDGNTTLIIKEFGNSGNAAAVCKACRDGGFTDWFLPASNQINTLFNERFELTNASLGGPYGSETYWSSTEIQSNVAWANDINWQDGSFFSEVKTIVHSVRAIRAF